MVSFIANRTHPVILLLIFVYLHHAVSVYNIERRVTSRDIFPHPSADTFTNPNKFIFCLRTGCERRKATCSRSKGCCTCECPGHAPNFFSQLEGCINSQTLSRTPGGHCVFVLQTSASRYIPTLTSQKDIATGNLLLLPRYRSIYPIYRDGNCKAGSIDYINKQGRQVKIVENKCSEVISIKSEFTKDGERQHSLTWTWKGNNSKLWDKLKGKLLKMSIICQAHQTVTSCLFFKAAGSYNDDFIRDPVESPKICPMIQLPTTTTAEITATAAPATTTTLKPITTTAQLPRSASEKRTSGITTTGARSTRNATRGTESVIIPPATLREKTGKMPLSFTTEPIENQVADKDTQRDTSKKPQEKSNWLVTGLIVTVAILLLILAASLTVLLRKRCKKKAKQRNGQSLTMNVLYHGDGLGPAIELPLPARPTDCADEVNIMNGELEVNFYESIDKLDVVELKGAATHEYAVAESVKSGITASQECRYEQLSTADVRAKPNRYESPRKQHPKQEASSSVAEAYIDMNNSSFTESSPLCPVADTKYDNINENGDVVDAQQIPEEVYEDMHTPSEQEPLVDPGYAQPRITK